MGGEGAQGARAMQRGGGVSVVVGAACSRERVARRLATPYVVVARELQGCDLLLDGSVDLLTPRAQ